MMTSRKLLLPKPWRDENVRIRHKLAIVEYPRLAGNARKARIIDDVWAEFVVIFSFLAEAVYELTKLKKLEAEKRNAAAIKIRINFTRFENAFEQLLNSPHTREVLQPATLILPHRSKHVDCCPIPPFVPFALQFPPSGVFWIVILATKCHIQNSIRPAIEDACGLETKHLNIDDAHYATEICRTFAGIEDALGDNPDACLPLFAPLLLAISKCPQELRPWLWCKFLHFEKLGLATFENPILKSAAKLWELSDIRPAIKGVSELLSTQDEPGDVSEG